MDKHPIAARYIALYERSQSFVIMYVQNLTSCAESLLVCGDYFRADKLNARGVNRG
jgi:hypothetical protein